MSVERKLRPTLAYLRATFPSMTAATAFKSLTYSLGGNIAPRRNLLTSRGLDGRWAPSTFLAWTADAFCENVGVDRKAYDDEVARCQTAFAVEYAAKTAAGGPGARRGGEEGEEGGRPVVEGPRESRSPGGAIRSAIRARAAVPAPESAAERREARRRARTEAAARNRDRTQEGGGSARRTGAASARRPSDKVPPHERLYSFTKVLIGHMFIHFFTLPKHFTVSGRLPQRAPVLVRSIHPPCSSLLSACADSLIAPSWCLTSFSYAPFRLTSSSCVPRSTTRPRSTTQITSAA